MEFNLFKNMEILTGQMGAGSVETLKAHRMQINDIAEYCRGTGLQKYSEKQTEEFTKNLTSLETYHLLLIKVADAPTQIHAKGATLMFMPVIADKLQKEEKI